MLNGKHGQCKVDAGHDCRLGDQCREKGTDVCRSAGGSEVVLDIQAPFPFRVLRVSGISHAHGMGKEIDVLRGTDGVLKNIKIMQKVLAPRLYVNAVITERTSAAPYIFGDQYFIDRRVSLPYTPFSRKQVFIKSKTGTSRLTASGYKTLYRFAFNRTISGKT